MQFVMLVESHKMCCKADAAQWTPRGRTAPLSEEQLYILASWPATLGNKKKGDAWKVLSVSGWLEVLVQSILISDKQGVMLQRRQMCYWYGRDRHLSVLWPPQCARMHHHHRPHWGRTFLLNHSLCINSLVLTVTVIARGAVMDKDCVLRRCLRNYILILYQYNIPYYHVSLNLYQECNLYLKITQVNWQIACKGNHFFLRILLAERLLSEL